MINTISSNYLSRTNFHGPKSVQAIEVLLYEDTGILQNQVFVLHKFSTRKVFFWDMGNNKKKSEGARSDKYGGLGSKNNLFLLQKVLYDTSGDDALWGSTLTLA